MTPGRSAGGSRRGYAVVGVVLSAACGSSPAASDAGADGDGGVTVDGPVRDGAPPAGWNAAFGFDPIAAGLEGTFTWAFAGTESDFGTSVIAGFEDWSNASDPTAPVSGPSVGRTSYPAGTFSNGDGGATWAGPRTERLQARRLYFRQMLKFSATYSWHSHFTGEKYFYPIAYGTSNDEVIAANPLNITMTAEPTSPAEAQSLPLRFVLTPQTAGSPDNYFQEAPPYLSRGAWHQVEVYFQMNTDGAADGVCRVWLDGSLVLEKQDVVFADGDAYWEGYRWTGTRGGGASAFPVPPEGQHRDYDHVDAYWSTTR